MYWRLDYPSKHTGIRVQKLEISGRPVRTLKLFGTMAWPVVLEWPKIAEGLECLSAPALLQCFESVFTDGTFYLRLKDELPNVLLADKGNNLTLQETRPM